MVKTHFPDPFQTLRELDSPQGTRWMYHLPSLAQQLQINLDRLPFSIKILLESVLRNCDGKLVKEESVRDLARWSGQGQTNTEVPFVPARVLLQDFTGVPCIVDLAAMRSAVARLGGNPEEINPLVPVDLVIDHSVQVDFFKNPRAIELNAEIEFKRNHERYGFLRWGQKAFQNLQVVPPATGIVHQVNLEYLASVVMQDPRDGSGLAYPDSLVGTDSHTTMINGLGVLGWGVGGIEAEAAMLGQPIYMLAPRVVGFKLSGKLREGVTATDMTLTITQMLRERGVVDCFVEFYGPGLSSMSLPDRATIANMSPEYGATMGFFPVDDETIRYLRLTGREDQANLAESYCKSQGIFRSDDGIEPDYSDRMQLQLDDVEPSIAGPKRPQDRIALNQVREVFQKSLTAPTRDRGYGLSPADLSRTAVVQSNGSSEELGHGAVVIAAITSCTNTSNPSVMLAAGLVARNAIARGLKVKSYVKTSMAPGSKVVTEYLKESGLLDDLEKLGFGIVGYGCTTCIGNSGPLPEEVANAVVGGDLVAASVLSGNRNFEGRIHPLTRANFLASPPLVVAFALAGTTDLDLSTESLGQGADGKPVFLKDIWPSQKEIADVMASSIKPRMFSRSYEDVFAGDEEWQKLPTPEGQIYSWDEDSTYIREPPFFEGMTVSVGKLSDLHDARVLVRVGDSVTTDHISPAGDIARESPAGRYLMAKGIEKRDFNSYGSRRGNHQVMMRGTFANIRLKNLLVPGTEGNVTVHFPSGEKLAIFDAAMKYKESGTPLIVLAGKEYGTGSSRDWAAKGPLLLGVKAVIAESYERIHRSNLVGMGILPLEFQDGESVESLGLNGEETFSVTGISDGLVPGAILAVQAKKPDGGTVNFQARARLDTLVDLEYYVNGGILQTVLRNLVREK